MILADEPTGQLDSNTGKEIMELLKTLNEEDGITVILVTHDMSISEYSRRRIVLSDGKIVSDEKLEK
jgi:putative ABC transport system ATP-binding protein